MGENRDTPRGDRAERGKTVVPKGVMPPKKVTAGNTPIARVRPTPPKPEPPKKKD